jgi:virginiamycin B lyase
MPGGEDSRPFGMAVDRNDRIWIVETGSTPNRLVGFDSGLGTFLTETDIPSGAGSVSHLHYAEAAGEIWFGTGTNYVGRARVH